MRILVALLLFAISTTAYTQQNNLRLTINFPGDINDSVFLSINKKTYGVFAPGKSVVFEAKVNEASKGSISLKKSKCYIPFYADPGEIEIEARYFEIDGKPCISKKQLKGGLTEEALSKFKSQRQSINKKFVARAAIKKLEELSTVMVKRYSHSYASIDVIETVHKELGKEWTEVALQLIDDSLSKLARGYFMKTFRQEEYLAKGNYIDFTQNDIDGSPFTLSSLRGQYVLLDFWASWCGPCRKENPKLKLLYEKYKDKGLEIVGISLDDKDEKWKQAVEKDGLPWIHVSDLKGWNNEISNTMGIRSIPFTILMDPEGRIIDYDLRGNELEKTLNKLLNNKD